MTINTAEIEARLAKATPGPWYVSKDEDAYLHPKNYIMRDVFYDENSQRATTYRLGMWTYPGTLPDTVGAQERRATADFVAHARTDIPDLLAALKAETARAEKAEEELEDERSWWPKWGLEIKAILERYGVDYSYTDEINLPGDLEDWIAEWTSADKAKQADLQSQLTAANEKLAAAGELVRKLGDPLLEICDHLEDEDDRVYLGSTNHADTLKDAQQSYWAWWLQEEIDAGRLDTQHTTGDGNGR